MDIKINHLAELVNISYNRLLSFFAGRNNLTGDELKRLEPHVNDFQSSVANQASRIQKLIELSEIELNA